MEFLSYTFEDSEEFISTYDEAPLWSAAFGILLLDHVELRSGITVVDMGSGAGFPLLELAGRLGTSCKLYGVDPWANANKRARLKIKNYGLHNVEILECGAEKVPLEANTIDLIVSNLGINNFPDPPAVFNECNRLLRPGGRLALTTNVNGHWKEFYSIFESTLTQMHNELMLEKLVQHQQHRGTVISVSKLFTESGFKVIKTIEDSFTMRFLDGSAFLNHPFVKLGWLSSWREMLSADELLPVFAMLEKNLNIYAAANKGLSLTVPMVYMEGVR